jgi:phosphate transport system substrate-binding protein
MQLSASLMRRSVSVLALTLGTATLAFAQAQPGGTTSPPGTIVIDGSSTTGPLTAAVAEEFGKTPEGARVRIPVGISGTGGGFKKFCADAPASRTDVSNASRPIKQSEVEACKKNQIQFSEVPVGIDGLSVVVNQENTWAKCLTVGELKRIFEPAAEKKILSWKQVRATFPDVPLALFIPGTDSGTFDFFTEVIVGTSGASRGDLTPSEDDNVLVRGVAGTRGGLGYFGFAYLEANLDKIKDVAIDPRTALDLKSDSDCRGVEATFETILQGTYQPLSRPLFIYPNSNSVARKPELVHFVNFYLGPNGVRKSVPDRRRPGQTTILIRQVGYVEFPDALYENALKCFAKRVTGTAFEKDGKALGIATVPETIAAYAKRCN